MHSSSTTAPSVANCCIPCSTAAAGRVTEAERKLRAVNEFVHKADTSAAVADLAGRLGGVEDSVAHLAAVSGVLCRSRRAAAQGCACPAPAVPHPSPCFPCRPTVGQRHERLVDLPAVGCGAAQDSGGCAGAAPAAGRRGGRGFRLLAGTGATPGLPCRLRHACLSPLLLPSSLHLTQHCHCSLCLRPQWLERAREALRREVTDIQQQHGYLASGLSSAAAAAAAAPASPQKVLAAQVLGGLSYSMRQEVGKELQALQLVDQLLDSVASQLKPSTVATGGSAATSQSPSGPAGSAAAATKAAGTGTDGDGGSGWTIAAAPAASASDAPGLQQQRISQLAYPPVPSSQQAVAAAAGGALAQLQQLAGGEQQLVQAAAALAAASGSTAGGGGSGGSNLRSTFAQMQQTLASVCELLQQDGGQASPRYAPSEAACQAATSRYLSRSNTALAAPRPSSPSNGQPKRTWMPGGSCRLGAGAAAAAVAATSGAAKEALRESVLGQAALEQRQRRLQQLYSELRQ